MGGHDATSRPPTLIDWHGNDWTPDVRHARRAPERALHRRRPSQCPAIAPEWEDPAGVPIDAFLFGGRRATVVPLVHEAFDWEHGVFLGATMASETTAAAAGAVGELRRDPFAMLPFCGYNMGDYFAHWLKIGERPTARKLPKIFYVNWFRKDDDGKFLWPGFGENSRVLEWIFGRCDGTRRGGRDADRPACRAEGALPLEGLDISAEDMAELLRVDPEEWKAELPPLREHFARFGDKLPAELRAQLEALEPRLERGFVVARPSPAPRPAGTPRRGLAPARHPVPRLRCWYAGRGLAPARHPRSPAVGGAARCGRHAHRGCRAGRPAPG